MTDIVEQNSTICAPTLVKVKYLIYDFMAPTRSFDAIHYDQLGCGVFQFDIFKNLSMSKEFFVLPIWKTDIA